MICPKCQMNIKDDARICVHCGMQFNNVQSVEVQKPSLVCPSCNSQIDSGLKFCTNCGADLSSVQVNSTPVVQSTPVINNENDRDRYLRAYFGKNYDSVMKSDFSIGTFFFGWLWLLLYGLFKPALNLFLICLGISFTTSLISVFIGGGKIFSLIGLANPQTSWMAKSLRLQDKVPGVYAVYIRGRLPEDVENECKTEGVRYRCQPE